MSCVNRLCTLTFLQLSSGFQLTFSPSMAIFLEICTSVKGTAIFVLFYTRTMGNSRSVYNRSCGTTAILLVYRTWMASTL